MDVTSLPDEMLTIVLKYRKYGGLMKMRKMNHRIDVLARRNKFCGKPINVDKFELKKICDSYVMKLHLEKGDDETFGIKNPVVFTAIKDLVTTLQHYLPLITIEREFAIGIGVNFGRETMDILHSHRENIKRVTQLRFCYVNFGDEWEMTIKRLYHETFLNVDTVIMNRCENSHSIYGTPASRDRGLKRLQLTFWDDSTERFFMDDSFLLNVAVNCREVQITTGRDKKFTLQGILQLIQNCIAIDGSFNRTFDFGLINVKTPYLDKLDGIRGFFHDNGLDVKITFTETYRNLQICKLIFGDAVDAPYVQFLFVATEIDAICFRRSRS